MRAQKASKKMHMSRSELYSEALDSFLKTHDDDDITRRLNEFYGRTPAKLDDDVRRAGLRLLKEAEW